MTAQDRLKQSQAQYEAALDTALSQLSGPNLDAVDLLHPIQAAADSYVRTLRETAGDTHAEAREYYLSLAQTIETGQDYLLTTLLEYRERQFPQAEQRAP